MHSSASSTLTCKNCDTVFTGNYCSNCGEKVYHDHDKSIPHFFEDALHFITHLDGSFFTTLKTIFTQPGQLSLDYCSGRRKKYFKPLSFFLLLVVLYLLFPLLSGLNMRMEYYPGNFGAFAAHWIEAKMASKHLTEEQLSEVFAHKSEKWSKVMLLVIIPFSAAAQWLLYIRKRNYFFDHLVLSTEINSFFLVMVFFIWAVILWLLNHVLPKNWWGNEALSIGGGYFFVGLFIAAAFRRFYNESRRIAFLKTLLFIALHVLIVYFLYKFLLFVAVMLTI